MAGVLLLAWEAHADGTADLAAALAAEGRWNEAHREALRLLSGDAANATGRIAFRSGDQELCDTVQAAVQKIVDNGTYAKIAEKYPDIVNNLLFLT